MQRLTAPGAKDGSVAKPAAEFDTTLGVGFYNIGWNAKMINNFQRHLPKLRADVLAAFRNHNLDVLCLNEVGEINIGLSDALQRLYPLAKQPVVAMFEDIVSDLRGSFAVYAHSHYVREGGARTESSISSGECNVHANAM